MPLAICRCGVNESIRTRCLAFYIAKGNLLASLWKWAKHPLVLFVWVDEGGEMVDEMVDVRWVDVANREWVNGATEVDVVVGSCDGTRLLADKTTVGVGGVVV